MPCVAAPRGVRSPAQSVAKEESDVVFTDLKDLLGHGAERETKLASDGFWDQFTRPTQEEIELQREEAERAQMEGMEDEEEVSEVESHRCIVDGFVFGACMDYSKVYGLLSPHVPMHVEDGRALACLMGSSIFPDLMYNSDMPPRAASALYEVLFHVMGRTDDAAILAQMQNAALGLIAMKRFDYKYSHATVLAWFAQVGLCPLISDGAGVPAAPATVPESVSSLATLPNIRTMLCALSADLRQNSARFSADDLSMLFPVFVSMALDAGLAPASASIDAALQACMEWLPVCRVERCLPWIVAHEAFFLARPARLVTLVRRVRASAKGQMAWIPILDHFLALLLPVPGAEAEQDADSRFVQCLAGYLEVQARSVDRSLQQMARVLELARLRLLATCIEDLGREALGQLRRRIQAAKDTVPQQPASGNMRTLNALVLMMVHVENYLRSQTRAALPIDAYFQKK